MFLSRPIPIFSDKTWLNPKTDHYHKENLERQEGKAEGEESHVYRPRAFRYLPGKDNVDARCPVLG
jgi:hypothetical protein